MLPRCRDTLRCCDDPWTAYSNPSSQVVGSTSLSPQPGYTWLLSEIVLTLTLTSGTGSRNVTMQLSRAALPNALLPSVVEVFFSSAFTASAVQGYYIGPLPSLPGIAGISPVSSINLPRPIVISSADILEIVASAFLAGDALTWILIVDEVLA